MTEAKTKIIYAIADAGFSGGPIQLLKLLEGLNKKGYELVVISPSGFLSKKAKKLGIKHFEFEFKRGIGNVRKLRKFLKAEIEKNPRVILHAQGVKAGSFLKMLNSRFRQILVYTEHNWTKDYTLPQNWRRGYQLANLRRMSRFTTWTVCVSKAVQDFLLRKKITSKETSSVIYNGVEFDKIMPRKSWEPIAVGTIASLHRRKGILFLLEAIAKFGENNSNKIILKVVGEGPEEDFLKQHAVDLKVNFDVQWLGVREDLKDFWSGINIYVQPSLDESFGMATAEAMGYEIPVIATTAGALPEIVQDGGLLVEPGNSGELAKAIENIASNKGIREENIERARKRVKKLFSVSRMVGEYERLYANLLNR
ncbi:glycosyltransferase family 4 protein [Candidatus Dojkabacteria bacterium]|nr:glycosyltransferase family 4 protein [Candidatus Dojkabacteria bacterium]